MDAFLSFRGVYNYDNSLFDELRLPEGVSKPDLINYLCEQTSDISVIYPEPDTLKKALGTFSNRRINAWSRLYNTTQLEYNPIDNYNRKETFTEVRNGSDTSSIWAYDSDSATPANKVDGESSRTITNTAAGNIGVTTTQRLITDERKLQSFDIYNYIVEEITDYFCIGVF